MEEDRKMNTGIVTTFTTAIKMDRIVLFRTQNVDAITNGQE